MTSTDQQNGHAPTSDQDETMRSPDATPERTDNGYTYGSFPIYNGVPDTHGSSANGNGTSAGSSAPTKPKTRALAPDLLRGLLMVIMAMDHTALALHTWEHGTGRTMEGDGTVVRRWNYATAYVVRSLTHLCASGFTFLLGMGVVYLTRSRAALGWSDWRLTRYFAVRMLVLVLVTVTMGFVMTAGKVWFLNMVLFSLAVDYFLAGVLYLGILRTEKALTSLLAKAFPADDSLNDSAEEPLLAQRSGRSADAVAHRAGSLSWHLHNAVLVALSVMTIFWNIWFSDTHGHCRDTTTTMSPENPFLRIWLWPVMGEHVMSGFPPLAWVSFAFLGVLYGRIMIARTWTPRALAAGHAVVGSLFFLLFVLTRVLRFGNLSEGCLRTPEHDAHPDANPYLVSPASFFYIVKYPPDVAFWALTMSGNLFLLALLGAIPVRISKRLSMLLDFGTTALFFYVVHLFVVFGVALPLVALFGHDVGFSDPNVPGDSNGIDNLFGYFGTWAAAMLVMWPLCRWYSRFKSTKSADSIWRFF